MDFALCTHVFSEDFIVIFLVMDLVINVAGDRFPSYNMARELRLHEQVNKSRNTILIFRAIYPLLFARVLGTSRYIPSSSATPALAVALVYLKSVIICIECY